MAITPWSDKIAIQSILTMDPYITEYLEFSPDEIYTVKETDELLGLTDKGQGLKQQIFIFNVSSEQTINPFIYGVEYQIDVSVPWTSQGTADLAIEQILSLLDGTEISSTHQLEAISMPVALPSETSLYQVGCRFVCYVSKITQPKRYIKNESEDT